MRMCVSNVELERKEFTEYVMYVGGKMYAWVEIVFNTNDLKG